jgi:hypothetical protein
MIQAVEYTLYHRNGTRYFVSFPDELKTDHDRSEAYAWCCKIYGGTLTDWFLCKTGDKFDPDAVWGTGNNPTATITNDTLQPYFLWPYADTSTTPEFKKEIPGHFVQQKCECGAEITFGQETAKVSRLHSAWCPKGT